MIICYTVLEIWCVPDVIIFHFWAFFALSPPNRPKNQNLTKMKKYQEISSFYTSVPKIMIICYTVPEIWRVTDALLPFYLPSSPENQNLKKVKKNPLDISSFYIYVPNIMIR